MADASYNVGVYRTQGGDELVVASSGTITLEGTLTSTGTVALGPVAAATTTATLPAGGVSLVTRGTTATGPNVYTIAAPVPGQPKWISCTTANSSDVARIKGASTGITFGVTGAFPFLNITETATIALVGYTTAIYHFVTGSTATPFANASS